jgi:hypothetical protein
VALASIISSGREHSILTWPGEAVRLTLLTLAVVVVALLFVFWARNLAVR